MSLKKANAFEKAFKAVLKITLIGGFPQGLILYRLIKTVLDESVMNISQVIAKELSVNIAQVDAAVALLNDGATVPFIARYRKEATAGLDDTQLRHLEERLIYLRELVERRDVIIASIKEQDKLTDDLEKALMSAQTKSRLEDLYLPYKPKRHTKAQIAREAGLDPLAKTLLGNPMLTPDIEAAKYINDDKKIHSVQDALDGAKQILMEQFSENADLLDALREHTWNNATLESTVIKDKNEEGIKFKDYFEYQEKIASTPSHRALALFRGQKEGFLRVNLIFINPSDEEFCMNAIANMFNIHDQNRPADNFLKQTVEWTYKIKLKTKIDIDCFVRLRSEAEEAAIGVFKENLHHLLMAAPAGKKVTLGLDPGFRTGIKTVVVSDTGKLLAHTVVFAHHGQNEWQKALITLSQLCKTHGVNLISIGNGTASRETEKLAKELVALLPELNMTCVVVSEAGASVYSASEFAAKEFPDLDVSYRGAISIARRLQDPLAELVKIDPKAIGVGQYQHDVNQYHLNKGLETTLEDCVNAVGADVNTASVPLLKKVAGLNETVAQNIISYREQHGRFQNRQALKKVPRLGEKTYEQAVGFLRIVGGDQPLDASAVHPESYPIVDQILKTTQTTISKLMGNEQLLNTLNIQPFITPEVGRLTLTDIVNELKKPGRDPRPEFKTAQFKDGIEKVTDLKVGMKLEGVVTNVTNFGAFVDIGVHQDGLVHISHLSDTYVADPNKVVRVGQIVKVTVMEIDAARNRIQLSMKTGSKPESQSSEKNKGTSLNQEKPKRVQEPVQQSSFASALQNILK